MVGSPTYGEQSLAWVAHHNYYGGISHLWWNIILVGNIHHHFYSVMHAYTQLFKTEFPCTSTTIKNCTECYIYQYTTSAFYNLTIKLMYYSCVIDCLFHFTQWGRSSIEHAWTWNLHTDQSKCTCDVIYFLMTDIYMYRKSCTLLSAYTTDACMHAHACNMPIRLILSLHGIGFHFLYDIVYLCMHGYSIVYMTKNHYTSDILD